MADGVIIEDPCLSVNPANVVAFHPVNSHEAPVLLSGGWVLALTYPNTSTRAADLAVLAALI